MINFSCEMKRANEPIQLKDMEKPHYLIPWNASFQQEMSLRTRI